MSDGPLQPSPAPPRRSWWAPAPPSGSDLVRCCRPAGDRRADRGRGDPGLASLRRRRRRRPARRRRPEPPSSVPARVTTVVNSSIPAKQYGSKIAAMENGVDAMGRGLGSSPVPVAAFARPVARLPRVRRALGGPARPRRRALTAALRAGNRAAARRAWATAFSDYLHLGAVYGLLPGDLNDRPGGLPGDDRRPAFRRPAPDRDGAVDR